MIRSFGDAQTQALFRDDFVQDFQGIAWPAKRRLEAINAAHRLDELLVPPSNRLLGFRGNMIPIHIRGARSPRRAFEFAGIEFVDENGGGPGRPPPQASAEEAHIL
jgi:hypothetical protein